MEEAEKAVAEMNVSGSVIEMDLELRGRCWRLGKDLNSIEFNIFNFNSVQCPGAPC